MDKYLAEEVRGATDIGNKNKHLLEIVGNIFCLLLYGQTNYSGKKCHILLTLFLKTNNA